MNKALKNAAFAAILGAGALVVTATGASAEIVCNDVGECWHVRDHYSYPDNVRVVVHPDDWRWDVAPSDTTIHYRWHEHEGRGYWNSDGAWVTF